MPVERRNITTEVLARESLIPVKDHFMHPTSTVSPEAKIGAGTRIWAYVQIRETARIGRNCMIGNSSYVDKNVVVGDNVNIHNKAMLYKNIVIEDDVFIGPGVVFTNDPWPRANVIRLMEREGSWYVRKGASVGANTTVLPHVNIGRYAMIGADSLVTRDIPDFALAYGSPARVVGFVSEKGRRLLKQRESATMVFFRDSESGRTFSTKKADLAAATHVPESSASPSPLAMAVKWLMNSGIQSLSRNAKCSGGVAGWYELDTKIRPFLYSEISGYFISGMLFSQRLFPTLRLAPRAHRAARWLLRNAMTLEGAVRTRKYLASYHTSPLLSFEGGRGYVFDSAVVAYGFQQLYKTSKRPEYAEAARRTLDFLLKRCLRPDGTFGGVYDVRRGKLFPDGDKWSQQGGAFHAKLALPLIDAYRLGWGECYRKAATRLLDRLRRFQRTDGRIVTDTKDGSTFSHPLCYALEGFLYAGHHLGRRDYLTTAQRGFDWLAKGVTPDGAVPTIFRHGNFQVYGRSDVLAQFLRAGSLLHSLDPRRGPDRPVLLETVRRALESFQYQVGGAQQGGFVYGTAPDGLSRMHLNTWATLFAVQALWMHEQYVNGRCAPEVEGLV